MKNELADLLFPVLQEGERIKLLSCFRISDLTLRGSTAGFTGIFRNVLEPGEDAFGALAGGLGWNACCWGLPNLIFQGKYIVYFVYCTDDDAVSLSFLAVIWC
ncbi:MAG: hypothetical protein ACLRMZ_27960 [Blautia marasmi]